jgi:mono/diheme cytochrome c family protein
MKPKFVSVAILIAAFLPLTASAQTAIDFFQQNCTSCHTIGGGRLTGPDLKDVTKQKDRAWIEKFIQAPAAVIQSGDPFALQLQQDARGVVMPTIPGLNGPMAQALLDLIESESALPKSRFAGMSISDRPFVAADLALGMQLFRGERRLAGGGPACISCHTVGVLSDGIGGGRLGPDLTLVYERLGGRKATAAWLSAPGTQTMQTVFRKHPLQSEEVLPLLAVFEDATRNSQPADSSSLVKFSMIGFAGLCVGLTIMGWAWRGRFRSVRRSLVQTARGDE